MEQLINFTIFGSGFAFALIVIAWFITLVYSEVDESGGFAVVSTILFLAFNYFWGNFNALKYLTFRDVGIYLLLGLTFALIRTYFKGKELKKLNNAQVKENYNLKGNVFRWWFLFPVSLITWVVSDLFSDLWDLLYKKIGTIFVKIFNA
jgi:hypothetical protein